LQIEIYKKFEERKMNRVKAHETFFIMMKNMEHFYQIDPLILEGYINSLCKVLEMSEGERLSRILDSVIRAPLKDKADFENFTRELYDQIFRNQDNDFLVFYQTFCV